MILQLLEVGLLAGVFGLNIKPNNAIEENNGILSVHINTTLTPNFDTFSNPEIFVDIDYIVSSDWVFTYDLKVYDEGGTYFSVNDEYFSITNWNDTTLRNIKFDFSLTSANYLYNPNQRVDTITWDISLDKGSGYDTASSFLYKQYQSDTFYENNINNDYELVIPIDLIVGLFNNYAGGSYAEGFDDGYAEGQDAGYQEGFSAGFAYADNQSAVATSIFVGIIDVALLPINFFLACLNFEVFGINIGSMVTALLTIMIVIIIVRIIFSGGSKK